jgi:hypothetical protein
LPVKLSLSHVTVVCLYFGVSLFCFFLFFALADFYRGRFGGAGFEEEERKKKSGFVRVILLLL